MIPNVTSNQEQFLDTIWGDSAYTESEAWVFIKSRNPKSDDQIWKTAKSQWPLKKEAIIDYIAQQEAQGWDVYVCPSLFKTSEGGATKTNWLGSYVLWADFDGNAPLEWDHRDPIVHERAGERLTATVPEPTLRVQSSVTGHEHIYWKLDEFSTSVDFIEGANKSIAYYYGADLSGWDCVQLLRPPGTTNNKHNLPVTIIHGNYDSKYSSTQFKSLPPAGQFIYDTINAEELPEVTRLLSRYAWDDEHIDLFHRTVEQGSRSTALMRLGYFCAEAGMAENEIFSIINDADNRWGKFTKRLDRKKQLVTIVSRAKDKHPDGVQNLTFQGLLAGKNNSAFSREIPKSILSLREMASLEISVEWIIQDFLEQGGFGMVASKPGIGKTQFSLQLGISVSLGKQFLNWIVPRKAKVLFLSLEMSTVALKLFTQAIVRGYSDEELSILDTNFVINNVGEGISLESQQGMTYLFNLIEEHKPELVIIDSFGKVSHGEITERSTRKVFNSLLMARSQFGCSFWLVHHNRKANGDNKVPVELDDIYGSTYITAETTICLTLESPKDADENRTIVNLRTVKNRVAPFSSRPLKLTRNPENLSFSTEEDTVGTESGENPNGTDNIFGME